MVAQAKPMVAERAQRVAFVVAEIADLERAERFDPTTMLNLPPFLDRSPRSCGWTALSFNASSYLSACNSEPPVAQKPAHWS